MEEFAEILFLLFLKHKITIQVFLEDLDLHNYFTDLEINDNFDFSELIKLIGFQKSKSVFAKK